jgi:hypothetical protein
MEAAAARAGMSASHWGAIERDKATGPEGQPLRAPAATIARMLAVLPPLTSDQQGALEQARPDDAAEILAATASQPGAPVGTGGDDRLIEALIASRPDSEFLGFLWGELGNDMKLAPRERRVRRVLEWVESHPVNEDGRESKTG